jgi:hypothetical protein
VFHEHVDVLNGFVPPEEQIVLAGDSDLNGTLVPMGPSRIFVRPVRWTYQRDGLFPPL